MTFEDKLDAGRFVVTAEVAPPKGVSLEKIIAEIAPVKGRVDAFNVTDLQSSVMRMSALAASVLLKAEGFETITQVTCRDRNRLALQSDILSAAALGLHNVLALTGDHPVLGDHPQARPVFDLDSVQLLAAIRGLERGEDLNGNKLNGVPPRFCLGAVVNPGADPLEPEIVKMEKKAAAGATFFQTQAIFDPGTFERFLKEVAYLKTKIIAGIVVLRSERMARHMNEHVPGVNVPQYIIEDLAGAQDKRKTSVAIASRLVRDVRPMCQGVHLMSIGWYRVLPDVLDNISPL